MRLHNFIVQYEIKYNKRTSLSDDLDRDVLEYMRGNPNKIVRIFGDNLQPLAGQRSNIDVQLKQAGETVCNGIKNKVDRVGLRRLARNWYRTFIGQVRQV